MVARSRRLGVLWLDLLAAGAIWLALAIPATAQNSSPSLFPKGGRNRTMPDATPLPHSANSAPGTASSAARRHANPPPRPDTVSLPYNLVWFDTQNRLASLFAGVGAQIGDKKTEGPNEIWSVKGLIAPNLQTSYFTFQQGLLIGLEFDYGQADWDTDKYNEVMGQFRRLLETKCQTPGEMISRKTDAVPGSTIQQTLMGYEWVRGDTSVQLFYFSAEDTSKSLTFRSISLHYHYRDPYAGDQAAAQGTPPPPDGQAPPARSGGPTVIVTPQGPVNDNSPGGTLPLPDNGSAAAAAGTAGGPAVTPAPSPTPAKGRKGAKGKPTPTPTPVPSVTPTPVPSVTPTPTATSSPSPTSPSPSDSPGASVSPLPSASVSSSPTPVASVSPSPADATSENSAGASPAADSTMPGSPAPATDGSAAASPSPEASVTPNPTSAPTATPTPTPKRRRHSG